MSVDKVLRLYIYYQGRVSWRNNERNGGGRGGGECELGLVEKQSWRMFLFWGVLSLLS